MRVIRDVLWVPGLWLLPRFMLLVRGDSLKVRGTIFVALEALVGFVACVEKEVLFELSDT